MHKLCKEVSEYVQGSCIGDQTLVSHHLRSLEEAGLVDFERRGKFKFYKLTEVSQRLLDAILNVFKKE